MMLYRMDWEALQKAKAGLPGEYWHYYVDDDPAWMLDVWGPQVFQAFREIPDFQLAPVEAYERNERGQLDMDNCIRVYDGLRGHLTPAEASQEVLWAGMCNLIFYAYIRKRWGYSPDRTGADKDVGELTSRFFFRRSGAHGLFRNTLAKCWWISHLLYDEESAQDPYWRLKTLGSKGFSTKVSDIFINYGFSRNRNILHGIIRGIQEWKEMGMQYDLSAGQILRPALKHLNAVGGLVVLDALPQEKIAEILMEGAEIHAG